MLKNSLSAIAHKKFIITLSAGHYLCQTPQGYGITQDINLCLKFFTRKSARHALKIAREIISLDDAEIIELKGAEK